MSVVVAKASTLANCNIKKLKHEAEDGGNRTRV